MKIEKLRPAFQDYLWGGTRLRDVYHKPCDLDRVAESWELSTHPAGESVLEGGDYDGVTLSAYLHATGDRAQGENCRRFDRFPVLIKLIDAKQALSIQVHPSDEYALRAEGELGKTEMWYVMDADPGAYLYFGVNRPLTKAEFAQKIADNTVLEVLNRVEVHPGDVFFIESGTIHAIGAGILICEIQQNSNCTYRVYDYDRRDANGNPRELHVQKALDVAKLTPGGPEQTARERFSAGDGTFEKLGGCDYFTAYRCRVNGQTTWTVDESSFAALTVLSGTGTVQGAENQAAFAPGDTLFVPAGAGQVVIAGNCELVITRV